MDFFSIKKWDVKNIQHRSIQNIKRALDKKTPIAIYGAGNLGQKILGYLGDKVVCFIDDTKKIDSFLKNIPIYSPKVTFEKYGKNIAVVWCIFSPTNSFSKKQDLLKNKYNWKIISFSEVCHFNNFSYYFIGNIINEKKFFKYYRNLNNSLSDFRSKYLLSQYLNNKFLSNFELNVVDDRIADLSLLEKFNIDELCYIDCGAFTGDTIKQYIFKSKMLFNRIVAVEPDPVNYKKLTSYTSKLPPGLRIELINKAVHIFNGKLNFSFNSNSSSAFNENSNCTSSCFRLDFFTHLKERCFIKIDIEGNEWPVLASSIGFIIAKKPILMISVYHKPTDLIDIYYLIDSLEVGYKFYLRSYGHDGADLALFCVPSIQAKSRKIFSNNNVKAGSLSFSELSNLNFEKFRKLASSNNLSRHLKSGFPDFYREGKEDFIFSDIKSKLKSLDHHSGVVLEIGPGCGSLPISLADHCRNSQKKLIYIDSEEVLKQLPNSPFIKKVSGYFPLMPEFLRDNNKKINTILIYSVLQYIYQDNHLDSFLKAVFGLLADDGEILIGDIPNISMRNRFLATKEGEKFSKKYSASSKTEGNLDSINNPKVMDDNLVLNILTKARLNGLNAWVLQQNLNLPMANRREDILIKKP